MFKVIGALLAAFGTFAAGTAVAQDFPTKQPVKIIVAVPAGGLTDTLARVTAEFLQKRLSQAVVVENRPGAGSTIGASYVANAPADGYTILLAGAEQAISPAVRPNLPYVFENFTFLVQPFSVVNLVVVNKNFPANSITELVTYMKANPSRVRYGSTGVGAIVHLGTLMFERAAGVKGVHVPYAGVAPIYPDIIAGNIDMTLGAAFPFPEGMKIIGASGRTRSPLYPDLATMEESGVKGAAWFTWFGFLAPPNLPKQIADRLTTEILAIVNDPVAIAKYKEVTKSIPDQNKLVGQEFKDMVLRAVEDWRAVAKAENIVINE